MYKINFFPLSKSFMKLYTKLILSLFILCPYLTVQMRFIQEFKLLLKIIFDEELSDLLFIILLSIYFTIFLVSLILSLYEIILSEIISGILILFSSLIYYRPFSLERKEYIDYFPSFDKIYVLIISISIFIHGFTNICKKTKKVRHPSSEKLLDSQKEDDCQKLPEFIIECNRKGFKNLFFFIIKNYLETITKNLIKILDFDVDNFDIWDDYSDSYLIKINYMTISVAKTSILNIVEIKNFIGKVRLIDKKKIEFSIIDRGDITNNTSMIKSIIIKLGFFIFDEKCINFLNETMNKYIENGYTITIGKYKYKITFNSLSLFSGIMRINFYLKLSYNKNMISLKY